ncbi:MAG: hypothetical protein IIC13_07070 [SAR324 cluster bacterium]|nr:hypothetical protein [SAR324 cluster bacterium]
MTERLELQVRLLRPGAQIPARQSTAASGFDLHACLDGESLALGEYQVTFSTTRRSHTIGSATLFRLEEYKLPEFEVLVSMPRDDAGRTRAFRVGDTVQAEIQASYFFGGPVAGANVEVLVYQKPFYHRWSPPRDYPWLYGDRQGSRQSWWGGPGQIIKRETLTTDDSGRVTISFETPAAGGQDFEYTIEARVTDASRREIVGTDSVRVTRQRYYVYPKPAHNLYRPGDTVEIEFKALDANQAPVTVQGVVKVTRQRWVEVWTDPAGREVSGWALREAQRGVRSFPRLLLRAGQLGFRVRAGRRGHILPPRGLHAGLGMAGTPPQVVGALVVGDAQQPGRQGPGAVHGCQVAVGLEENRLRQIAGGFLVLPQMTVQISEHLPLIALHQHAKPVGLPRQHRRDEVRVA